MTYRHFYAAGVVGIACNLIGAGVCLIYLWELFHGITATPEARTLSWLFTTYVGATFTASVCDRFMRRYEAATSAH